MIHKVGYSLIKRWNVYYNHSLKIDTKGKYIGLQNNDILDYGSFVSQVKNNSTKMMKIFQVMLILVVVNAALGSPAGG